MGECAKMPAKAVESLKTLAWQAYRVADGLRAVSNKGAVVRHILGRCSTSKCEYCLRNGLRLMVNNTRMDRTAIFSVQEIFNREIYHLQECDHSQVIVDLGANIGVFALYASWRYPTAKIYAVEPDSDNAEQLQANVAINGLQSRISVLRKAVSAKEGEVFLFRNPDSSRGHSLAHRLKCEPRITVSSVTLEQLFDSSGIETCDFLKMDIEGAEYEVIYGCRPSFLKRIKVMAIEHHQFFPFDSLTAAHDRSRFNAESLGDFLTRNGFTVRKRGRDLLYAVREPIRQTQSVDASRWNRDVVPQTAEK